MLLPYCQLRRGHVAVDLFVKHDAPAVQRAWTRLAAAMAALALFLAYLDGAGHAGDPRRRRLSRVLGWPEWPFYLPGIASLLLWAAVAALQVLRGTSDG